MDCGCELGAPVDDPAFADAIRSRVAPGRSVVVVVPPEDRGLAEQALRPVEDGWFVAANPDARGLLTDPDRVRLVDGRCVVVADARPNGWHWLATEGIAPPPPPPPPPPPRPVPVPVPDRVPGTIDSGLAAVGCAVLGLPAGGLAGAALGTAASRGDGPTRPRSVPIGSASWSRGGSGGDAAARASATSDRC